MDPMDTYDDTDLQTGSHPEAKTILDMDAMTAYYFKIRRPLQEHSEQMSVDANSTTTDDSREQEMDSELAQVSGVHEEMQLSDGEHTPEEFSASNGTVTAGISRHVVDDESDSDNKEDIPQTNEGEESSCADSSESSSDEEVDPGERNSRFTFGLSCGATTYGMTSDGGFVYRGSSCHGANYRGDNLREANRRGSTSNSSEISMFVVFHKPPAEKSTQV